MAALSIALYALAGLMLVGAIYSFRSGQKAAVRSRITNRFHEESFQPHQQPGLGHLRGTFIDRWMWRSGIRLNQRKTAVIALAISAGVLLIGTQLGGIGVLVALTMLAAIFVVWPNFQFHRRVSRMAMQVPIFLDQVVRGLATGRNLDGALRMANEETRPPLNEVMNRVQQAVDLGEDVGEALRDAARLYDLRELHFIALAVQISHDYGSSPKEMLESTAKLVRHREQVQRELRAMTGETRISAWTLSILPSAIALYMAAANPEYLQAMWNDPGGQTILIVALLMQLFGALILWRMVKSV